jgi:hypothetical protein
MAMSDRPDMKKARDLEVGDVFRLHIYGEVLSRAPVADGKRIKIKIVLEDQGQRRQRGALIVARQPGGLEFTDAGCVLEFLCLPGRTFHLIEWWDDDDDEVEVGPVPTPEDELV